MDEAYLPISEMLARSLAFRGEIVDQQAGVRSWVYELSVDMPVELTVEREPDGALRIGSTPPIYYVDTAIRPSYHQVQVTARLAEDLDGDTEHILGT